MPRLIIAMAVAASLLLCAPAIAAPRALEAELVRLSTPAGGIVGIAAWRLDGKGDRILINADQPFPMASTFKVAVAGAILAKVDRKELSLAQLVPVPRDMVVESLGIAQVAKHPGISLSVANLLELMLTVSDNTATDLLTRLAGGPPAVTAWVRGQGVQNLRVDRDTAGILRDFFHLPPGPFPDALAAAVKADPGLEERGSKPNPEFDEDQRDTSTPRAMAALLDRIATGKALSASSTALLIEIMERNTTGATRIRGRLPADTVVAEKTGTVGGSLNDAGIVTLPGGKGKIVLALFVKKSAKPFAARETAIAEISRAVYDYYLFGGNR